MTAIPLPPDDTVRTGTDRGATSIEYSLMAALIGVVIVGMVTLIGLGVNGLFSLVPTGV